MFLLTVLGEILTVKKSRHAVLNPTVVLPMDAGRIFHGIADDSQSIMMASKSQRSYGVLYIRKVCRL